jgi:uncharacterized protein YndB with AHSA1/START domain
MTVTVVDAGPRKVSRTVDVQAPAAELFAIVADPRRHGELDGSGTVLDIAKGPERLSPGAEFSVKMRQKGVPYQITSRVTDFEENRVVEWQHPLGHRWRWEFEQLSETATRVTEVFDYSHVSGLKAKGLEIMGAPKGNATGIEETLRRLAERYPA